MSVALDNATYLPKPRLPRSLGGEGRDPIFQISVDAFPATLVIRPDLYPHACVEPSVRCLLPDFESALASTRGMWSKVHE